jgi:hypothetical protein
MSVKRLQGGGPVANRTEIVCLCEGAKGRSIDEVFINKLMKILKPAWVRAQGSNVIRPQPCGSRTEVIKRTPEELKRCLSAGGHTTLMVWADCDDNCDNGDALKNEFWDEAKKSGITRDDFDRIVFIFAKDRLENWIQFLNTGGTNEALAGPRLKHEKEAADAAKTLADFCIRGMPVDGMPPSLQWSCRNWRALVARMAQS